MHSLFKHNYFELINNFVFLTFNFKFSGETSERKKKEERMIQ